MGLFFCLLFVSHVQLTEVLDPLDKLAFARSLVSTFKGLCALYHHTIHSECVQQCPEGVRQLPNAL